LYLVEDVWEEVQVQVQVQEHWHPLLVALTRKIKVV
jgi:hypothetical protein